MTETPEFDVLHLLRLKGIAALETVAVILGRPSGALRATLDALDAEGLVRFFETPRLSGWKLTEAGVARHAGELAARRSPELLAGLTPVYGEFLSRNVGVKELSSSWQRLLPTDTAGRWAAVEELGETHDAVVPVLDRAGLLVPRFASYGRRLEAALGRLRDGDDRYFTALTVDSYHTVWFECHEDFLQTLGRSRAAEGSF